MSDSGIYLGETEHYPVAQTGSAPGVADVCTAHLFRTGFQDRISCLAQADGKPLMETQHNNRAPLGRIGCGTSMTEAGA